MIMMYSTILNSKHIAMHKKPRLGLFIAFSINLAQEKDLQQLRVPHTEGLRVKVFLIASYFESWSVHISNVTLLGCWPEQQQSASQEESLAWSLCLRNGLCSFVARWVSVSLLSCSPLALLFPFLSPLLIVLPGMHRRIGGAPRLKQSLFCSLEKQIAATLCTSWFGSAIAIDARVAVWVSVERILFVFFLSFGILWG